MNTRVSVVDSDLDVFGGTTRSSPYPERIGMGKCVCRECVKAAKPALDALMRRQHGIKNLDVTFQRRQGTVQIVCRSY